LIIDPKEASSGNLKATDRYDKQGSIFLLLLSTKMLGTAAAMSPTSSADKRHRIINVATLGCKFSANEMPKIAGAACSTLQATPCDIQSSFRRKSNFERSVSRLYCSMDGCFSKACRVSSTVMPTTRTVWRSSSGRWM